MDLSRYFGWTTLAELTAWETYIQRDRECNITTHPRETAHKVETNSHTYQGRIQ